MIEQSKRIEIVAMLAHSSFPLDKDEAVKFATELWEATDEQLMEICYRLALHHSPLRNVIPAYRKENG